MSEYAGFDVSKEETTFCVKDEEGKILARGKAPSDPEALFEVLRAHTLCPRRIVLETGTMSAWLARGLRRRGMPVEVIDARQAHAVMKLQPNKTDANDAELLAEIARSGFCRPVAVGSEASQERRMLLKARTHLVRQRRDTANAIRGLLGSFGIRFPKGAGKLAGRVRLALRERPGLAEVIEPLLSSMEALKREIARLDALVVARAGADPSCRLLMSVPGVGPVTALAFAATIDDPARFGGSRTVGAYLGLTPRRQTQIGANRARTAEARRVIDGGGEGQGRHRPHARHAHQQAARRIGPGPRHDQRVQTGDLPLQRLHGRQQRLDHLRQSGAFAQCQANPPGQLARPLGEPYAERSEQPPDGVRRVAALPDQMRARLQKHPPLLRRLAANRHRTAEAAAGDLRQQLRVVGVRLVGLKLHHGMGLTGINHLHRHAAPAQTARKPGRHRARLQNDAARAERMRPQNLEQRLGIARRLASGQNLSFLVLHAECGLFLRNVKSGILAHGRSPFWFHWGTYSCDPAS